MAFSEAPAAAGSENFSPRLVERKLQHTPFAQEPEQRRSTTTATTTTTSASGGGLPRAHLGGGGGGATNGHAPAASSGNSFVRDQVALMERGGGSSSGGGGGGGGGGGQLATQSSDRLVDIGGRSVPMKVVRGDDGIDRGEYFDSNNGMKFSIQVSESARKKRPPFIGSPLQLKDPVVTTSTTNVRSTSQGK